MGALFGLAFLVVPVVELLLFIWVQDRIGLGWTLLGIVITAIIGAGLVRRQGMAVWSRFQSELVEGGMPARQLAHGAMVLVGGALLLTPGFLTDAIGLALMVPAIREFVRRAGLRIIERRAIVVR